MRLYCDYIFPRLMDRVMRGPAFQEQRRVALRPVEGRVLEIGFGTGLNVPHYPSTVAWLTAIEPGVLLEGTISARVTAAPMPIEIVQVPAEELPWSDRSFDCVVSTWTLCTIADPVRALAQIRRVLKEHGRLVFLEHGRSENASVARWQNLVNPVQRVLACGCNLNRRIDRLIADNGFTLDRLDRFVMPGVPRIGADMYRGVALPSLREGTPTAACHAT